MSSPCLSPPQRRRRDVIRSLIARLEVALESTSNPDDRRRLDEQIGRLRRELGQLCE